MGENPTHNILRSHELMKTESYENLFEEIAPIKGLFSSAASKLLGIDNCS